MYYEGYEALDTYVKKTDIPSFTTFVEMNNTNIARWSAKYGLSVSDFYGTWRRRFALSLKNHKKTECLDSNYKMDKETWGLIKKLADLLSKSTLSAQITALKGMMAAAPSVSTILKELLEESQQK
ncbi:hypothetical protein BDC45DRAFT_535590 [Circinella umbellata]|nr:hypothetical protein BDC45DRAFT_535590 [Circinella umbellata]